jgi:signal transduction histidine kinase/CheY-like chemotaxis protein
MPVATREIAVCLALTQAIGRARTLGEIYEAALDALQRGLAVHRSAVLLVDGDGVMRFEASRGLSEAYRRVVERRWPLAADARGPDPLVVPDVRLEPSLAPFRHALAAECIGALASIPIASRGGVIGTFMLYSEQPRAFAAAELQLAAVIAAQVAFAVERARAEDAALEAARLKDEFLATLSHELRTPLSAIFGWVQLLQTGQLPEARAAEAVATIGRNARLQAQRIDALLDVSRLLAGPTEVQTGTLHVPDLLDQVLGGVRPIAAAKGIVLRQEVHGEVPPVRGDAARLQQVLGHLLSNAVRSTPAGGRVTVACAVDGRDVVLTVRDTGDGIPAAFLPPEIDGAGQADRPATRQHGVLWLAIARHLVERHGGSVMAHGDGDGAGFTVRLPAGEPESPAPPPRVRDAARPTGPLLHGVRALIVDDDGDARDLVATLLGQHGADVLQAANASAAWQTLAAAPVDVFIADLAMPGTDGCALMRGVRLAHPSTPALALTACARPEDRRRARLAGFDAFCTKPFEADGLLGVVRTLLDLAAPAPA